MTPWPALSPSSAGVGASHPQIFLPGSWQDQGSLPFAPLAPEARRQVLVVVQDRGIQPQTALFLTLIKLGLFIK